MNRIFLHTNIKYLCDGFQTDIGSKIYGWCKDLFHINRSLSGEGVRKTLAYLKNINPELQVKSFKIGSKAFDWVVPDEWNIRDAWVKNSSGEKIIDFQKTNLHVLGYSKPVHKKISLKELDQYLYSLPEQPSAIPYVTSYYKKRWGFCLSHNLRKQLKEETYEVFIDSDFSKGELNYGELKIQGETEKEVLLSCNICHPSLANNELSGPTILTAISEWLLSRDNLKYSYRILFIPETIGSIAYLSENLGDLQKNVIAGFAAYCMGDEKNFSFISTPHENRYSDRVVEHVYKNYTDGNFKKLPFTHRGSDERQYCSPRVDLPVNGVCRSKSGMYSEYHTSLDDLSVISPIGLQGGYDILSHCIQVLEHDNIYSNTVFCEPQLGSRGLYPTLSTKEEVNSKKYLMNIIAYSDGERSVIDIANILNISMLELLPYIQILVKANIIEPVQKKAD